MCRWAIGAEFCALRTETRMVREQNSITGQPRPRTVWVSARSIDFGVAVMDSAAGDAGAAAAAVAARTAAVRAAVLRTWPILPHASRGKAFSLAISQDKTPNPHERPADI
jgi:hypothetical protein